MSNTKIKAAQFHGVVGHGTDGYFLMTNADGSMSWAQASTGPSVTSVTYPGDDLAADPAGNQTVVLTGTGFASSGMTVSIGGTTAPSVAHDSNTQLTITTPSKAAGDYDIVVTNTVTGASGTFVNGISYNGVPTWTTATGSLGTFESETTISTITLAATEPDGGTITFNITNGALPSGLSLTGANIDGTTTAESSTTLYSFTIEAIDDENQATPRNFSITVNSAELVPSQNFTINTYTGNGSTQSIEGKIGTAASFNGITPGGSVITTNSTAMQLQEMSVSAWINMSALNTLNMIATSAVQQPQSSGDSGWVFSAGTLTQNGLKFSSVINGTNQYQTIAYNFSLNTWYQVAFTRNSSGLVTFYVNGNSIGTDTRSGTIEYVNNPTFSIGGNYYLNQSYWSMPGKIDQVRLFNKAISSSEVTTLYNEPSNPSTASTTDIFDDGSGVALYEFEEGASDTGGVSGKFGSAAIFNGSSSKIDLPNFMPSGNAARSISMWIKTTTTAYSSLFRYGVGTTNNYFLFRVNSGTHLGVAFYANDYDVDVSSTGLFDGNWHQVGMTYDGTTVRLYVDGAEQGSGYNASSTNTTSSAGRLGYQANPDGSSASSYFNGSIDDVRFYSDTLTLTEMGYIYNNTTSSIPTANLLAHYKLDGDATDEQDSYDGTATNVSYKYDGTPTNVNFLGMAFQPDFVWIKSRTQSLYYFLADSVRGDGLANTLSSNTTDGESFATEVVVNSFDTNGFTLNSDDGSGYFGWNMTNNNYVAWCFKGGGNSNTYNVDDTGYSTASAAGLSSANGTTLNGASVNTQAGFSIINYETNINGDNRPAHGLTQEPELIIFKPYDTSSLNWYVMTKKIDGSLDFLFLNTTDTKIDAGTNEFIDSTHFRTSFGTVWGSIIAYCFHSVEGYQKVGTYTGGTANNPITIGFKPRWIMIKCISGYLENWVIYDSARSPSDPRDDLLLANTSNSEYANYSTHHINFDDNGFTLVQTSSAANGSGGTYIYLAIA